MTAMNRIPIDFRVEATVYLERCILRTARDDIAVDDHMDLDQFTERVLHKMGYPEWAGPQEVVYACRILRILTSYGDVKKFIPIGSTA